MPTPVSSFSDLIEFAGMTSPLLMALILFGCTAVMGFVFWMPLAGNVVGGTWATVMGEQLAAKLRGQPTGCDMDLD